MPRTHELVNNLMKQGVQLRGVRETASSFRHTKGSKNFYKQPEMASLEDARAALAAAVRYVVSKHLADT